MFRRFQINENAHTSQPSPGMKFSTDQFAQTLANFAIVTGIVFLALEVRQNNELLDTQARQNRSDGQRELNAAVYDGATGLALIIDKAESGFELRAQEQLQLERYLTAVIVHWEFWYQDFLDGVLDEDEVRLGEWKTQFHDIAPDAMSRVWEKVRNDSSPEFVEFMEANVVNP